MRLLAKPLLGLQLNGRYTGSISGSQRFTDTIPATKLAGAGVLSSDIGAFALVEGGGSAIVALRHGVHRLDLTTGVLHLLAPPPFDPKLFRFNEGLCDCSGRFWIGVMFDRIDGSPPRQRAWLHSFTLRDVLKREEDAAERITAWQSARTAKNFLAHSYEHSFILLDLDFKVGSLGQGEPSALSR